MYHQVLAIDPRYAPAWNELGRNAINEAGRSLLSNEEGAARAREAVQKALAIDPEYAPAYAARGFIEMVFDNDPAGAAKSLERALALDPANMSVLNASATLLGNLGRRDEALALQQAAVHRDPVALTPRYNLGLLQRWAGRLDDAIATWRTVASLSPRRGGVHANIGVALVLKGDALGGLAEIEQEADENRRLINLPIAYHALHRKADSDTALATLIEKEEKDAAFNIAYVYAFRGEADKAFAWLDKAVEYRDPGLSEILQNHDLFMSLQSDARWLPFLRKIGKAPEQLAKIEFKVKPPAELQAEASPETTAKPPVTNQ